MCVSAATVDRCALIFAVARHRVLFRACSPITKHCDSNRGHVTPPETAHEIVINSEWRNQSDMPATWGRRIGSIRRRPREMHQTPAVIGRKQHCRFERRQPLAEVTGAHGQSGQMWRCTNFPAARKNLAKQKRTTLGSCPRRLATRPKPLSDRRLAFRQLPQSCAAGSSLPHLPPQLAPPDEPVCGDSRPSCSPDCKTHK